MTPERWSRIKEVLNAALEREQGERVAYLDGACGSDEELRQEVERLLRQEGEPTAISSPVRRRDVTGQTLAHYQVADKIGEGGMGAVYKAWDTHLDRFVAIKVLPSDKVSDATRHDRFVQEAKSASSLNHPNIIHIYDIDQQEGLDFIAMEYVEGKTLDELVPRRGMELRDLLRYAVQIADALAAAHGAGIIHRDLKPGNLMVDTEGRVKVLDFGLAKLTDPPESAGQEVNGPQTEEGMILGTTAYMSPEQAEGRKVDARSDIFSFGVLLFEMITGNRPFRGDSRLSTMAAIVQQDPEPLPEGTPLDLKRIVGLCLRKDPARRYQHMADIKVALETLREESESGSLPTSVPAAKPASVEKWAVAFFSILVVAALGWLFFLRPAADQELPPPSAIRLTTLPGIESEPEFSPNGERLVFAHRTDPGPPSDLYVMDIEDGVPVRLTDGPTWEHSPAWSPDDRWIAFGRTDLKDWKTRVCLISPLGGPQRILTELAGMAEGIGWSPDSKWLVVGEVVPNGESGLHLVSVENGKKQRLTAAMYPQQDRYPAFSPDGRQMTFVRCAVGTEASAFTAELDIDSASFAGEPRRLFNTKRWIWGLAWTWDGRHIVHDNSPDFATYRGNSLLRTSAVSTGGNHSAQLDIIGEGGIDPAISAVANRLVFARGTREYDILRYRVGGDPEKFISSTVSDSRARYSPDGSRIAFVSERGGGASGALGL